MKQFSLTYFLIGIQIAINIKIKSLRNENKKYIKLPSQCGQTVRRAWAQSPQDPPEGHQPAQQGEAACGLGGPPQHTWSM